MERYVGQLIRIVGNEVTFILDRDVDLAKLARLNGNEPEQVWQKSPIAEVSFFDQRRISPEQRKKIFALFEEISVFTGFLPMEVREIMEVRFIAEYGGEYFSLSDVDKTTAKDFISYLIEFCFQWDIPFKDKGITLADDVSRYLWLCLKYRKCCVCGKPADRHHVDTVGMGRNRRTVDHSEHRMMALCREHHQEIDLIGQDTFDEFNHVMGIKLSPQDVKEFKI